MLYEYIKFLFYILITYYELNLRLESILILEFILILNLLVFIFVFFLFINLKKKKRNKCNNYSGVYFRAIDFLDLVLKQLQVFNLALN
jgi:hypothetical protein